MLSAFSDNYTGWPLDYTVLSKPVNLLAFTRLVPGLYWFTYWLLGYVKSLGFYQAPTRFCTGFCRCGMTVSEGLCWRTKRAIILFPGYLPSPDWTLQAPVVEPGLWPQDPGLVSAQNEEVDRVLIFESPDQFAIGSNCLLTLIVQDSGACPKSHKLLF